MALLIKRLYEGYFYLFNELADPRANDYFLLRSPVPTLILLFLWTKFIFNWGPEYMKNREPLDLKRIMIGYNIIQVTINAYLVYEVYLMKDMVSWRCAPIDYSYNYWPMKLHQHAYLYFVLKILDLVDTVFFVLRKKSQHMSFLHIYHHFGMVLAGFIGAKFVGGGHSFFVGLANCIVHTILYSYYLLTAYDSKYSKLVWMKKLITQAQLAQFIFLLYMFGKVLIVPDCTYTKAIVLIFIPQNLFMIVLFTDFYVRTYIIGPRKKKLEEELKQKQELQGRN